jgi:hypothetical protein
MKAMINQPHEEMPEQIYQPAPEELELRRRASAPTLRDLKAAAEEWWPRETSADKGEFVGAPNGEAHDATSNLIFIF